MREWGLICAARGMMEEDVSAQMRSSASSRPPVPVPNSGTNTWARLTLPLMIWYHAERTQVECSRTLRMIDVSFWGKAMDIASFWLWIFAFAIVLASPRCSALARHPSLPTTRARNTRQCPLHITVTERICAIAVDPLSRRILMYDSDPAPS